MEKDQAYGIHLATNIQKRHFQLIHLTPNKISDHTAGDVADDFYHRYKVSNSEIICNGFRLSISWPRVIPTGKLRRGVNKAGIAFYNSVINHLIPNTGITPFVTIFHWDRPQPLEDEYGGFLSPRLIFWISQSFVSMNFGDRVKHWATFNEPWTFSQGKLTLLSQKGHIGTVLVPHWFVPCSNSKADIETAQRAPDFMYGWFLDPLVFGDYPKSMRGLVGKRLPKFTPEQSKLVKGFLDFLGLNYYTANTHYNELKLEPLYFKFSPFTAMRNGKPIGEPEGVPIFFVYPKGLREILVYTKNRYNNPPVYVTENGMGEANITTVKQGVKDYQRVRFYRNHLKAVKEAIG
ncbi:unnamed protein product [Coffea canephora]|uniref:Uncharacterized protein n=1 Tax=Coffea canephora TaxID=49390 RepID=A0A068UHI9_COFCA|nr:unnamed protein product [Coffea canephora]